MPVFRKIDAHDDKGVLFLHIPKTGGTSIEHCFKQRGLFRVDKEFMYTPWKDFVDRITKKNSTVRCSLQHLTFRETLLLFPDKQFDAVFLVVRDPYDRMISEFHYLKHRLWVKDKDCRIWGVRPAWAKATLRDFDTFVANVYAQYLKDPHFMDNHFIPQYSFLDGIEGHVLSRVTRIYSFDHIVDGTIMSRLRTDLGDILPWEEPSSDEFVHKNRFSPAEGSKPDMSDTTKRLIEKWFHQDFVFFGFPSRI